MGLLLGYDVGSSSVKAALVDSQTGQSLGMAKYPEQEMEISSPEPGWAEQNPSDWWRNVISVTGSLLENISDADKSEVLSIGIAYQMHGLVLVDKNQEVLRPSIIWCDSRAVEIGDKAFVEIGKDRCLSKLLNSPGNFTASKLRWVQENEPEIYDRVHKFMLPGDYIAMKMTGEIKTTVSGLSEGILWDFEENQTSDDVLNYYSISKDLVPDIVDTFSDQGPLTKEAANELGLNSGIPVSYRAGDQPNNALALNVKNPGEIAGTGGTSGVIYAVGNKLQYDQESRVNGFAHVNHTDLQVRIGTLLCINGAGIQYSWMRKLLEHQYLDMEEKASQVEVGSDGVQVLSFGNGAERIFNNQVVGTHIHNLQLNRHTERHLFRATLEGIAFAFVYGIEILDAMGIDSNLVRVGNDNLFRSDILSTTIATLSNTSIEILDGNGAVGAAKAGGYGAKVFTSLDEAFQEMTISKTLNPLENNEHYLDAYELWKKELNNRLNLNSE